MTDEAVEREGVRFMYRNYRGEIAERHVTPISIRFGSTDWHPEPQWLLRAYDHRKKAEREFSLSDCQFTALDAMPAVGVRPLEWEDYPADDGPVLSKAVAIHGTYFIVDDTDDFSGLYLELISHDDARWWQSVRSTRETLMERVHDDDLIPIKAAAQADYERRIRSALTPTPDPVAEAWRPIETAPKDGSRILAYEDTSDPKIHEIWWEDDNGGPFQGWTDDWDTEPEPSHWMPLSKPRALTKGGE